LDPVHTTPEKFEKRRFYSENVSNVFLPHYVKKDLKMQQAAVILDLCLRKTRAGKSSDYRDVIVFDKALQNVFRPH